jgi:ribosomal protein S12 methylthiotransferase
VPGAAIRTTLIVGFPGETDADFQELMKFVEQVRFDHLGVFTYSDAEDLPSHRLPGHLSKKVAQFRHDTLMARQMEISASNLSSMIGDDLAGADRGLTRAPSLRGSIDPSSTRSRRHYVL